MVEFALLLPLLLMLLLGIVEFGRIFGASLTVNHCAREGARLGALGATDAEIVSRIRDAATALDEDLLAVDILPAAVRDRGQEISVTVSYPVAVQAPFISLVTGETVTVGGVSIMRVE